MASSKRGSPPKILVAGQPGGHRQQLFNGDPGEAGVGVFGKLGGQQLTDSLVQALDLPLGDGDPDQRADDTLGHRPDLMSVGLIQTLPIVFVEQIAMPHDQDAANLGISLGHLILDHCQCRRIDRHGLSAARCASRP